MVSNAEEPANATASVSDSKSSSKRNTEPRQPRVASKKRRAAKNVTSTKGRAKGQKGAKRAKPAARVSKSSKSAKVVELLKRPGGATLKELMKTTGWQAHSVRGFLSGTVGKKMGLGVSSSKAEDGDRRYSVEG